MGKKKKRSSSAALRPKRMCRSDSKRDHQREVQGGGRRARLASVVSLEEERADRASVVKIEKVAESVVGQRDVVVANVADQNVHGVAHLMGRIDRKKQSPRLARKRTKIQRTRKKIK